MPGCFIQLLTVIVIKEPGGQPRFSSQLFTFPKLPVVLAAGRRCSCFILGGAAEGLNVTDYRLHLFCRLHFFFPPLCASLLLFHPALLPSNVARNDTGALSPELSGGSGQGTVQPELYLRALFGPRRFRPKKTPFSEALASVWGVAEKNPRAVLTASLFIG